MEEKSVPLISLIIPVYNIEPYVRRCLDSAIAQTYRNIEIIVVDDGSTDGSPALCDFYAAKDSRLKVIHRRNGGLSAARNSGLDICSGEYISFIDGDDCVRADYVQQLYAAAAARDALMSAGSYDSFETDEAPADNAAISLQSACVPMLAAETANARGDIRFVTAWGKLFHRSLWRMMRFPEGKLHEDEFTTYRAIYASGKVAFVDIPLYYYFQRAGSIMGARFNARRLDALDALDEKLNFYKAYNERKLCAATVAMYVSKFLSLRSLIRHYRVTTADARLHIQAKLEKELRACPDISAARKAQLTLCLFFPLYDRVCSKAYRTSALILKLFLRGRR